MIDFLKYPKMKNYNYEDIERFGDKEMYSSEKIDGSNTQIDFHVSYGKIDEAKVGSRNKFIPSDCKEVLGKVWNFVPKVRELVEQSGMLDIFDCGDFTIYIYGEIFGSKIQLTKYDVTKEGKVDYRIYDCFIKYDNRPSYIQLGYQTLVDEFGDMVAPLKDKGSLGELLDKPLGTNSEYGAPLEEGDVYHPLFNTMYKDREDLGNNIFNVKRKHKEFEEVSRGKKVSKAPKELTKEQKETLNGLLNYITPRRVENILSHGDIERSPKSIGKLIGATITDALEEYAIDNHVDKDSLKVFGKRLGGEAGKVVREVILGGN